jgi:D-alanine-D-alanine ligase
MDKAMKKNILVLFGGASSEHEVSVMSATSVLKAIDLKRYHVIACGITPEGFFELYEDQEGINNPDWKGFSGPRYTHDPGRRTLLFSPGSSQVFMSDQGQIEVLEVDAVFPLLHGPFGEDGRLQGLLEMCGLPYVGAGVLASAIAMDKGIAKRIFAQAGILQSAHLEFRLTQHLKNSQDRQEWQSTLRMIEKKLNYPVFVKPANLGSSVGISKARNVDELNKALMLASGYDEKVLVEAAIDGREIECAVLGSREPKAALPAEVLPSREFYDYEDKYFSGVENTKTPADLTAEETALIKRTAVEVYQLLECQGLARVDFFLEKNTGRLLVNEVNTMPGFTSISLYPKMWEASGVSYTELIHLLIEDAFEKSHPPVSAASNETKTN